MYRIGQKYAPLLSPDPSASGPYAVVGEVTVEMELTLDHSVLNTYLVSSPLLGDSFRRRPRRREEGAGEKEEETLESLDMGQLIVNVYRLKRALTPPVLLTKLLDWPFLFLPLWSYACLCFAPWKAPLYALLCYSANGYLNSKHVLPPQFEAWPAVRPHAHAYHTCKGFRPCTYLSVFEPFPKGCVSQDYHTSFVCSPE